MCSGSLAAVFRSYKSCTLTERHVKTKQSLAAGLAQEMRLSIGLSDNKKAAVQLGCFCCLMSYHPLPKTMQSCHLHKNKGAAFIHFAEQDSF